MSTLRVHNETYKLFQTAEGETRYRALSPLMVSRDSYSLRTLVRLQMSTALLMSLDIFDKLLITIDRLLST